MRLDASERRYQWGPRLTPGGVEYRIWAPDWEVLTVEVVAASGAVLRTVPLGRDQQGYHTGHDPLGRAGDAYRFRLDLDRAFPDPASRRQLRGVHGPSVIVADPVHFPWTDRAWERPRYRDLVIYELHLGTFTPEGTFQAAIAKLPHLRDLRVNAIEIMPIADFPGARGWGYDGVLPYAPAACYGHPDDLRSLVNAAHAMGIAVILDVVYNHLGPDGNYLSSYASSVYRRDRETPWGAAFNLDGRDSAPVRAFFAENPRYWMDEFHIDGFRLDATHEITDSSPNHLFDEIAASVHERGGWVIGEDARNEARMITPSGQGGHGFDGVWADDFHHSVCVSQTRQTDGYYADYKGTLGEVVDVLQNGWLYRGGPSKVGGAPRGTECRHLPPQAFVHCISNHDQVGNRAFGDRLSSRIGPAAYRAMSALICLTPYTPMLFMGQEWAASSPFTFFTDHHEQLGPLVTEGRRKEFAGFGDFTHPERLAEIPDPQADSTYRASHLKWPELESGHHAKVLALYRACLQIRAGHPALRPLGREGWQAGATHFGAAVARFGAGSGSFLLIIHLWASEGGSLVGEPLAALPAGLRWGLLLSSNESRFGGEGPACWDPVSQSFRLGQPETFLLQAQPA